jgi:hypothetical protein
MLRTITLRVLVTTGLALPSLSGCGGPPPDKAPAPSPAVRGSTPAASTPKTSPDPNDQPITEADVARPKDFADAVARIKAYRDSIRDDIAAGRPTKAHRALDELDIVLNWLPGIARDGGVPKQHWEEVNTTAQRIQELFNKVHGQIDAKEKPDYDAIAGDVDTAIGRLAAIPAKSEPGK